VAKLASSRGPRLPQPPKWFDGYCGVCGRSCLEHVSGACRACRADKPEDWVAPEPRENELLAALEEQPRRAWRSVDDTWRGQPALERKVESVDGDANGVMRARIDTDGSVSEIEASGAKPRCRIEGCTLSKGRPKLKRGLCDAHYQRGSVLVRKGEATWEELLTDEGIARIGDSARPTGPPPTGRTPQPTTRAGRAERAKKRAAAAAPVVHLEPAPPPMRGIDTREPVLITPEEAAIVSPVASCLVALAELDPKSRRAVLAWASGRWPW
jgi:hypothetical protein